MSRPDLLPDPSPDLACPSSGDAGAAGAEPARPVRSHHRTVVASGRWRPGTHASELGHLRYRGQMRRGARSPAVVDDENLRLALAELEAARLALATAHHIPRSDRRERREAMATALGKLALAARFVDEVVLRRGGQLEDAE